MPHRCGLRLRIHQHTVPVRQCDRGMISMPDATADIDRRIPPHRPPAPSFGLRLSGDQRVELSLGQAARTLRADIDGLSSRTVEKLDHVWLAGAAPTQRFVGENESFIDDQPRVWNKEPFPLTDEGLVLAAVPVLRSNLQSPLQSHDFTWLQGFHRGLDRRDATIFRHSCDEPVSFVMTAQELVLLVGVRSRHQ